ncbi:biotin/lipoyl-containing protein [Pseudoalteromonas mariniglutinosa]|uniref:biotin/lipoyl-containing protein n=1 Tax=Pseudoalteromonas mariniglutinosa TaxID=206042 RepID=UPI00384D27E5
MNIDVKVPTLPDSIHTADIAKLYVSEGQRVYAGDVLFDVETEKVVLEVMADCNGIIENITIANGSHVNAEQVVMTVKQLADSEMPARPTAQSANNSKGDFAEEAMFTPPLFTKFNVGLIIALAVGALGTLIVLGK